MPRLRQLVKKVLKECFKCRRFRAKPLARPPVGNVSRDRTEGNRPFQVVGVNYEISSIRENTRESVCNVFHV